VGVHANDAEPPLLPAAPLNIVIRWSTDETPWPAAGHPLDENVWRARGLPSGSHEQRNAQRSDAGWVTSRDRLHGRVVARRWVVEMAPSVGRNTVVDGRVRGPDPRRQQACPRSPGTP